ncbi:FCS-Like Zinc finger 8-like [Miscanthus floridulus]|uniref:FCS-Like Zinc finger 8-like n=1 Tax=Miscanthus floridulus TaxID=154761 RepID=UPI003458F4AF
MVESNGHRSTTAPAAVGFFRVPGLFVRLSSKGGVSNAVDADSVWSPTSPLDFKHHLRSSPPRVGLGLVDALTADETGGSMQFEGRSSFLDSIKPFLDLALPKAAAVCGNKAAAAPASSAGVAAASLDKANEYDADCEEYTCVISRGANPRTTHILAGETVEAVRKQGDVGGCRKVIFSIEPLSDQQPSSTSSSPAAATASVASGRCCCCMKRLQEDMDIFIYLGEKAFCSSECRKGYIEEAAEELMILDPALNL